MNILTPRHISLTACLMLGAAPAWAEDFEVSHWWTSGSEAAAAGVLARNFEDLTGHTWIDGAIGGGAGPAKAQIVSRIIGGDPMGAMVFAAGRATDELIEAGLMTDVTALAEAEGWTDSVNPPDAFDICTHDGKIYCVPLSVSSFQWLFLSNKAFADIGLPVPANFDELAAAAPQLIAAGKLPLAVGNQGWQQWAVIDLLLTGTIGAEMHRRIFGDKAYDLLAGPDMLPAFERAVTARDISRGSSMQNWNEATARLITGEAGGQLMGDWAIGEFNIAGLVAGQDYTCLPGAGLADVVSVITDAIYFPAQGSDAKAEAQQALARTLLLPATQLEFAQAKGAIPLLKDIEIPASNDCMAKGAQILAEGKIMYDKPRITSPDTTAQLYDLGSKFFASDMTATDLQTSYVDIMRAAD